MDLWIPLIVVTLAAAIGAYCGTLHHAQDPLSKFGWPHVYLRLSDGAQIKMRELFTSASRYVLPPNATITGIVIRGTLATRCVIDLEQPTLLERWNEREAEVVYRFDPPLENQSYIRILLRTTELHAQVFEAENLKVSNPQLSRDK